MSYWHRVHLRSHSGASQGNSEYSPQALYGLGSSGAGRTESCISTCFSITFVPSCRIGASAPAATPRLPGNHQIIILELMRIIRWSLSALGVLAGRVSCASGVRHDSGMGCGNGDRPLLIGPVAMFADGSPAFERHHAARWCWVRPALLSRLKHRWRTNMESTKHSTCRRGLMEVASIGSPFFRHSLPAPGAILMATPGGSVWQGPRAPCETCQLRT